MTLTQTPRAPTQSQPAAAVQLPATPAIAPSAEKPSTPRPVKFRRLVVFDSLADAVGCGGPA